MNFADAESTIETSPELLGVLEELRAREPLFHRPELGTTRADFEAQTTEDFWEVGASGRRYRRDFVLDMLEKRFATPHEDNWRVEDLHLRALDGQAFAVTYTLIQGTRRTLRLTLWQRYGAQWKARYHQGTLITYADP
jgi:hypothetical protein